MISDLLPYAIAGVVAGALYGLAATGLVLTYKTTGVFNFGHGAVGAATAYVFYDLREQTGLATPLAFALSILVVAPLLGLVLYALLGKLSGASTVQRIVATVGVLLLVEGLLQLRYGIAPLIFEPIFPVDGVEVADITIGYDQMITVGIALACLAALEYVLHRTRLGLQMTGAVDNPNLLALTGTSPGRVQAAAWVIGCSFAGLSGILVAPSIGLDSVLLSLVVVQAFGAAAVGGFRRTIATFGGGIAIGVIAGLVNAPRMLDAVPFLEHLPGLDQSVSFLVLFIVLLVRRKGTLVERAPKRAPSAELGIPLPGRAVAAIAAVTTLVAAPFVFDTRLAVLTLGAVFVTIYASLFLLVEVSGQVTLCQAAFVAVGATTFAHLTQGVGLPWAVGVAGAAAVAVPLGAIVAIPAIRLSGLFLALATFGFGVVIERLVYGKAVMFGHLGSRTGARPSVLGLESGRGYFYLCAAIGVISILAVALIRRSRLGRLLRGLSESPLALVTHGTSVNVTRVLVFCISGAMAAVGGALYIGVVGSASSSGIAPTALISLNSLLWVAVLMVTGRNFVLAPVLGSLGLVVIPSFITSPDAAQYVTIAFGASALLTAVFGDLLRGEAREAMAGADPRATSPVKDRTRRLSSIAPTEVAGG